jgi:LacI family transcriptional regulator
LPDRSKGRSALIGSLFHLSHDLFHELFPANIALPGERLGGTGVAWHRIPMQKPVTLADVAKAAGVALGTASRVLNNFTDVDAATRQRVLHMVEALRYRPLRNRRARENGGGDETKTRNIGLILLGMDDSLVHVPVLTEILHGVESAVAEMSGNLLLANLPNADRVPALLKNNQVEGLIVKISQYSELPNPEKHPVIKHLMRFPIVWVWAKPTGAPGDLCSFNHETAATIAAAHLHEYGHRRVAFLNPKKGKSSLEHIKKEFSFACESRGLSMVALESASSQVSSWPEPALTSADELVPLVEQWQAIRAKQRPTAIFVPADNIAVHVYTALEQKQLKIPRDVSVIACNHEKSLISSFKPRLTTIDVCASRIGTMSVEQLVSRLRSPLDNTTHTFLFEPTLVAGSSVARV